MSIEKGCPYCVMALASLPASPPDPSPPPTGQVLCTMWTPSSRSCSPAWTAPPWPCCSGTRRWPSYGEEEEEGGGLLVIWWPPHPWTPLLLPPPLPRSRLPSDLVASLDTLIAPHAEEVLAIEELEEQGLLVSGLQAPQQPFPAAEMTATMVRAVEVRWEEEEEGAPLVMGLRSLAVTPFKSSPLPATDEPAPDAPPSSPP